MKDYAIDRMTRLWIVLIPTFILILGLGIVSARIDPQVFSVAAGNEHSATAFVGNLVGLQEIAVPTFGGNFPLWSLSNETWYYVLFPLLVIALGSGPQQHRLVATLAAGALAWLLSGPLMLYFAIWLLGAVGSRIELRATAAVRSILFLVFAGVAVFFRLTGENDDLGFAAFPEDLLFSVLFILFLTSMQVRLNSSSGLIARVKQVAKFFADFSFTLYVIHVPLIGFSTAFIPYLAGNNLSPNDPAHLVGYLGVFAAIVAVAYLFHLPFEANTQRVRAALKGFVVRSRSAA